MVICYAFLHIWPRKYWKCSRSDWCTTHLIRTKHVGGISSILKLSKLHHSIPILTAKRSTKTVSQVILEHVSRYSAINSDSSFKKSCSSISHDDNRNIPPPPSHLFNHTQTSWNERILFLLSVRVCVYVHSIMVKHNLQTIKSSLFSTVNTATKLPMVKVQQTSWRLRLTIRDKSNLFHN